MKSLEIKPAIADQVEQILALDQLCFGGIWSKDGYLREIDSPNASLQLLWLTDELTEARSLSPELIGIACMWSIVDEAHITLLGIHPQYRHQGLGMLLLNSLLQEAKEKNLHHATLEVKVTNDKAIQLYKKFGFQIAGTRKNYYPKTGEDASILWLNRIDQAEFQLKLDDYWQQIGDRLKNHYSSSLLKTLKLKQSKYYLKSD